MDNPARVTGTDDAGRFVLRGLPDGSYDVSISAMGRAPQRQRVTVSGGGVQTLDVALAPGSTRGRHAEVVLPAALRGDEPPAPGVLAGLITECMQ